MSLIFGGLLLFSNPIWAQAQWETGVLVGRLLPNQIAGVTEIMSLAGIQLGYQMAPMIYAETYFHMGSGSGQDWKSLGLSFRLDQSIQDFLVSAYAGVHSAIYQGNGSPEGNDFGGHVGGAAMTGIGGPTWLRADMKFSFGPGTALFLSLALLLRF